MTDNEIINALKCCIEDDRSNYKKGDVCVRCPFYHMHQCTLYLRETSLDLINRQKAEIDILIRKKDTLRDEIAEQQAEIERLKGHISHTNNVVKQVVEDTKFKAIQEFAERLKAEVAHIPAWGSVAEKKIDNLVKEMVGESNV